MITNITTTSGTDFIWSFSYLVAPAGAGIDLTGCALHMMVRATPEDTTVYLNLSSNFVSVYTVGDNYAVNAKGTTIKVGGVASSVAGTLAAGYIAPEAIASDSGGFLVLWSKGPNYFELWTCDSNCNQISFVILGSIADPLIPAALRATLPIARIIMNNPVGGVFTLVIPAIILDMLAEGVYVHNLTVTWPDGHIDEIWHGTLTHVMGPTR